MPPCTNKRRTTTNLKTKNNQNCQRFKLYRSLTTKELKKNHSSRLVGGTEICSQGAEDLWQSDNWRTGASTAAAGGLGEAVAGGAGDPTLACG